MAPPMAGNDLCRIQEQIFKMCLVRKEGFPVENVVYLSMPPGMSRDTNADTVSWYVVAKAKAILREEQGLPPDADKCDIHSMPYIVSEVVRNSRVHAIRVTIIHELDIRVDNFIELNLSALSLAQ